MMVLRLVSAIGIIVSLGYYAAACVAAARFRRRMRAGTPALPKIAPRVAVLKPLQGSSEVLARNIISFLELDYPRLEFIFGVSNYDDPATEVPVALRVGYRFASITLVVGEEPGCANRKIAKLIRMAERAPRADIFVLSDADVEVDREHLQRVVSELVADERTGVVTCLYRARAISRTIGGRLETLFINTDFAPMAILSEAIEPIRHAFGATIAIKRPVLEAIGGFRTLKDLLADDFFVGRLAAEHGYEVKLGSSLVTIHCEERTFGEFWNHQLRWARTYRTVRPVSLATILIHGPFWAVLFLLAERAAPLSLVVLGLVIGARLAMSAFVMARGLGVAELVRDLWLVPLKDLVVTAIWFASLASNKVLWAGRRFRIIAGGKMQEV